MVNIIFHLKLRKKNALVQGFLYVLVFDSG